MLRRRGSAEAGAVFIKLDRLDGRTAVFGPAPQIDGDGAGERCFLRLHKSDWIDPGEAEAKLRREIEFDADLWIVEVESRSGELFVEIVQV